MAVSAQAVNVNCILLPKGTYIGTETKSVVDMLEVCQILADLQDAFTLR